MWFCMRTPVGFCTGYFRSSSASPSTIASAELGNSCSADDFCWTLKETPEVSQLNLIKLPWWNVNISFRFWFGCVCFFFCSFQSPYFLFYSKYFKRAIIWWIFWMFTPSFFRFPFISEAGIRNDDFQNMSAALISSCHSLAVFDNTTAFRKVTWNR